MVFSSLLFLYAFLPACLLCNMAASKLQTKNYILLAFSLFFYAWGEPFWVILMILTGFFIYWAGLKIDRYRGRPQSRFYLILAIIGALSSLAIFKYLGFTVENLNLITGLKIPVPSFSLPIGISFYTFQTLTYAIDLYRGDTKLQKSAANFLLYEALFPQLIAGPIVRYADVAEQIDNRTVTYTGFARGISRFLVGLGKKVLIANYAGQLVTRTLGAGLDKLSVGEAWLGLLAFALQIYFDFSGYSDMAIGLGRMFGFEFKENFNYPYISNSITEFWRRWHISLSTFFRDYVYIPLGGNRKHLIRNMLIVWGLTGLWHGASWNFILWGLYFFLLLLLEKKVLGKLLKKAPAFVGHFYAMFAVLVGWAFFYFTDMGSLLNMLSLMFGFSGHAVWNIQADLLLRNNIFFYAIAIFASTPLAANLAKLIQKRRPATEHRPVYTALVLAMNMLLLFYSTAALVGSTYNPFLYFRF
ncbi:MAG: MBOAT family O-acyltransferase [Clostridiaceae bacterium]|nr:MBOAT family O-acyltransferase [Clostridiaceae bacterium]